MIKLLLKLASVSKSLHRYQNPKAQTHDFLILTEMVAKFNGSCVTLNFFQIQIVMYIKKNVPVLRN